jgi:hypothetical protein
MQRFPYQSVPDAYLRQFFKTVLVKARERCPDRYEEAAHFKVLLMTMDSMDGIKADGMVILSCATVQHSNDDMTWRGG